MVGLCDCMGFAGHGFGSRGTTEVSSVRSCQELPPFLMEPKPAGSKMDLLLAKAGLITDGGSCSGNSS